MKLNLSQTRGFSSHRSGWQYCLNSLKAYHSNSGLFVCDFIERQFSWELSEYYNSLNRNKIPYTFPWIGFLHNPHNMPEWFDRFHSPQAIFGRPVFQESLKKCRALFVLSDYLAEWVRSHTDVPVISMRHATEPGVPWSPHRFVRQDIRKVVQVGYWLRRMESIALLKVPKGYKKVWLPSNKEKALGLIKSQQLRSELSHCQWDHLWGSVETWDYIDNITFDDIYSSSVIFLDFLDSSANNAVVEAIVRCTPMIVNRHPAVVEYLGPDYPLYFNSLEHVYNILQDTELIISAHEYLKRLDKGWASGKYFVHSVKSGLENVL